MKNFFQKSWGWILSVLLTFWAIRTLFIPGFFPMHDDEQIARLYELTKVLFQGQIPPRWVPDLGYGYGFPLFNFYPPLVYYLGFLVHLFGFSYIDSTKIIMGLGFILSAVFMYLWINNRFGKWAGVIAAVLYTYAPYHSVDIYVRGAFSEFFSFVWIPAALWSLDRLFEKKNAKWAVITGIFFSLILLTHDLVALQAAPLLFFYIVYLFIQGKRSFRKLLVLVSTSAVTALGLTAYFWLPSLAEKQFTLVDAILTRELASYKLYFVCIRQFWNSPWGYGGSVPGCSDGLSFQVGPVQLILAFIGLLLSLWAIFTKKKIYPLFLFGLFIFSLFIQTKYSQFLWDRVQPFWYIQFPWRFLLFSSVFSAALGGFVFGMLQTYIPRIVAWVIGIFLIGVTIFSVGTYFQPLEQLLASDASYISYQDISWRVSNMSYEYVPKQVTTHLSSLDTTQLAITKQDIPTSPITVKTGQMDTHIIKNFAADKVFSVLVKQPGVVQINTYAFPGWKVIVDGQEVRYNSNNKLDLITFPLTTGIHEVQVVFTNTPVREIANILSIITLIGVLFYIVYEKST